MSQIEDEFFIAEELLLVALHGERGKDQTGRNMQPGLASALLLDLARRGISISMTRVSGPEAGSRAFRDDPHRHT